MQYCLRTIFSFLILFPNYFQNSACCSSGLFVLFLALEFYFVPVLFCEPRIRLTTTFSYYYPWKFSTALDFFVFNLPLVLSVKSSFDAQINLLPYLEIDLAKCLVRLCHILFNAKYMRFLTYKELIWWFYTSVYQYYKNYTLVKNSVVRMHIYDDFICRFEATYDGEQRPLYSPSR